MCDGTQRCECFYRGRDEANEENKDQMDFLKSENADLQQKIKELEGTLEKIQELAS